MGYQESWFYIEPQHKFKKLIQAYEKAEQSGYYEVAGAEPHSVIVLKQPFGDIPAGKKLLWVCGDRGFHCAADRRWSGKTNRNWRKLWVIRKAGSTSSRSTNSRN